MVLISDKDCDKYKMFLSLNYGDKCILIKLNIFFKQTKFHFYGQA